jgi:succinate dehydrogenase hydrophobic anchor subunit
VRCPRCGNDAPNEEFICSFCGARLRIEPIEKIKIFKRQEGEKWSKSDGVFKRIFNVIRNPSRAFWDISHQKDGTGPFLILFLNGLTLGLWALATYYHLNVTYTNANIAFLEGLSVFIIYSIFGILYYLLMFFIWNFLFSLGANFSSNLNNVIKIRYKTDEDTGKKEEKDKNKEKKDASDSLGSKKPGKTKMMFYAYTPLLVINLICALILFFGLPSVSIPNPSLYSNWAGFSNLLILLSSVYASPIWATIDVLQILTLSIWIPITMSIALRDLSNSSTLRLFIGCVIIGILTSYMFYFLRPTLGWNFNIISQYGATTTNTTGTGTTTTSIVLMLITALFG